MKTHFWLASLLVIVYLTETKQQNIKKNKKTNTIGQETIAITKD